MPTRDPSLDLPALDRARRNVSRIVMAQARMRRERVGFGWRPADTAPSDYGALLREFAACETSGLPLRVSNRHSDATIYDCPETNLAMRFWHDTGHVLFGLSFELDDELELADHHLEAVRGEGFGPDTMEHQLLHADTFGQTFFQLCTGLFVGDQVRFDTNCTLFGVEEAVARERSALRTGR
jgi:hypothetical protein